MKVYGHRGFGRHKQEVPVRDLKCPRCRDNDCEHCADVLLARVGLSIGCMCGRDRHSQVLRDAQQGAVGRESDRPPSGSVEACGDNC